DEGDASERPSDSPPIPSPPHPGEDQPQIQSDLSPRPLPTTHFPDSIPEGSGGNHGGQLSNDASLSGNEDDYMETEDDQNEERTSSVVLEEKESAYKEVSIEAPKGTDKKNEGTDKKDGGTDNTKVSTDRQGEGTPDQNEGKRATQTAPTTTSTPTPTTPTPIVFGDDETIVQVLIITSQN
ncbi:hypothetical protein Tco_0171900, partial [Tanacetum coccineum]